MAKSIVTQPTAGRCSGFQNHQILRTEQNRLQNTGNISGSFLFDTVAVHLARSTAGKQHPAQALLSLGVRDRVIIHKKELGLVVNRSGEVTAIGSFKLPEGFIKGTTGAGDAFCAGALYAIHEDKSDREILEWATTSALGALREADAVSGMKTIAELKTLTNELERNEICL